MDETFISPDTQKMHASKRLKMKKTEHAGAKAIAMGMLDRDARKVRAKVVPNVKRETLRN